MKLSILNWKHLKKYILPSFMMFAFSQSVVSNAADVTPVYLGKGSDYVDSDVPPAIKLNEAVDGLEKGTYLYRVKHKNLYYYTPVTPREYRDTKYEPAVNKEKYRNWGPWEMGKNNVGLTTASNKKYHKKVTIKAGTKVEGPVSSTSNASTIIGTLSSSISVYVRAHTSYTSGDYVYFSLEGTPYNGKNMENIGRVKADRISTNEEPEDVFRTSSTLAKNFSYLANYKDTTDSSHIYLEDGQWKNASNAPGGLAGKYGEWSYLGYNSKGEPLGNPYFPSNSLHYKGCSEIKNYDWRSNPFSEKSTFDGDAYSSDRYNLIKKLLDKGILGYTGTSDAQKDADIKNYMKKFSFLTHPSKDTAVLKGKRTVNDQTRLFSVENSPGDLYIANIDVYDGNTKVAYYSYDIKNGEATQKNGSNIVQGKTYRVEVKLGNAVKRKILARKNQATIGITKESKYLDLSKLSTRDLTGVKNGETSSNTIGSKIGDKSEAISFSVKAPTDAEVFDIYALVGNNHNGTDNFDYNNDAGFIRMYTKEANTSSTEIVLKKANLKATGIELLDPSNNDKVVYSSSGNITNTAIIPRKSYKIRYTMKNVGDKPTIKTKTSGSESADGTWTPGEETISYPTVEVPISYTNTLKVKGSDGSIMDVSENGSNKKLSVNGSTNINLEAGGVYSYTTGSLYFANPYLKSSFTIKATGIANSDTTDDTFSKTINDLYDAVIRDVKIYPVYEYVLNGDRKVSYNITYSAKINAANHIKNVGNISVPVRTKITVGNKSVDFDDMLIAKDGYQKFSHTVENVLLRSDTTGVKAVVTLNYDRKAYETDYTNNSGESNTSVISAVNNPFDGSNSDKVSRVDNSDGSSLVGGGSLNNNCLIPRRANSWTVSHRKHTWTSSNKNYTINGSSYSEPIYTTTGDSSLNKNYTESFEIKQILFKSKETEGKGLNRDGWIDLLDTSSSNRPNLDFVKVKAGFGFELKIVTEYRTNILKTQPTSGENDDYTGLIDENDINHMDELFVELPGTDTGSKQTRKILSTTGYSGTSKGLLVTEKDLSTDTEIIKEWTYTIKPSNTLGINSNIGKIFIPTGLKDGDYKISIYTPPISGAVSDSKGKYTSLCDRRDIYIEVSGAYTDDLNTNIIQ